MLKAVITGSNTGIGLACTKLFLEKGWDVAGISRNSKPVECAGRKSTSFSFDLTNIEGIPALAKKIGDADVLVNNAGIMKTLPIDAYPIKDREELMAINLYAPAALAREFSVGMAIHGKGRIVSIASIAAHIGHPDIWYGASKAGIVNLTKSLALLLGPKGIQCNCIAPGPVDTPLLSKIPKDRVEKLKQGSVEKRLCSPDEVAQTVWWLAAEAPNYINGICVDINDCAYLR